MTAVFFFFYIERKGTGRFSFREIEDSPRLKTISLVREYEGEVIKVVVDMPINDHVDHDNEKGKVPTMLPISKIHDQKLNLYNSGNLIKYIIIDKSIYYHNYIFINYDNTLSIIIFLDNGVNHIYPIVNNICIIILKLIT